MDYASQWSHQGINGVVGNKKSILGLESSISAAVVPCSSISKETTQTLEKKGSSSSIVKGQKGSVQHQVQADSNLSCPRCQSTNTKFCYYNNYSLSQPRYFCKACRRYWTQGGSLRNVPVGGGSRKNNKRSSSSKKDMMMLGSHRPDSVNQPVFQSNPQNPSPIQGGHDLNMAYDTSMLPMLPPINPRFITSSELTLGNFMALNVPPPGTVGDVYPTGGSFSSSFQGLKPTLHYFTLGRATNNNNNGFGSGSIAGDDNKCKDQKDEEGIHHQEASGGGEGDGGGLIYDNEQHNGGGQGDQSSAGSDGYNNNWNMFGGGEGGSSYSSWQL